MIQVCKIAHLLKHICLTFNIGIIEIRGTSQIKFNSFMSLKMEINQECGILIDEFNQCLKFKYRSECNIAFTKMVDVCNVSLQQQCSDKQTTRYNCNYHMDEAVTYWRYLVAK